MRYFNIPEPVKMVDILNDEPSPEPPWTFAKTATLLVMSIVQKNAMDLLDASDLKTKLKRPVGEWVELTESEWKALETEAKRPSATVMPPAGLLNLVPHFRAILNASDRKPAVLESAGDASKAP